MRSHRDTIVDQFTRQAEPFATAPPIRNERTLTLLVEAAGTGADDTVLDVACGPGLVAAAFAARADRVTGIDLTPAMIARAEATARDQGVANVTFQVGDVLPLPFPEAAFSIVVSRLAFHHFQDPAAVLQEMRRVCRPGGRVVVCDLMASNEPAEAAAFHRMEMLRDPSHARALTLAELGGLFVAGELGDPVATFYDMDIEVEALLARSFPAPGDEAVIRAMFESALPTDAFGLRLRRQEDGRILVHLSERHPRRSRRPPVSRSVHVRPTIAVLLTVAALASCQSSPDETSAKLERVTLGAEASAPPGRRSPALHGDRPLRGRRRRATSPRRSATSRAIRRSHARRTTPATAVASTPWRPGPRPSPRPSRKAASRRTRRRRRLLHRAGRAGTAELGADRRAAPSRRGKRLTATGHYAGGVTRNLTQHVTTGRATPRWPPWRTRLATRAASMPSGRGRRRSPPSIPRPVSARRPGGGDATVTIAASTAEGPARDH